MNLFMQFENHSDNEDDNTYPFDTQVYMQHLVDCAQQPPVILTKYSVTGTMMRVRQRRNNPISKKVIVNGKNILLWRYGQEVLATAELCPHQGQELLLGDIEDYRSEGKGFCVTCPGHSWKFSLDTGECVNHSGASDCHLTSYPAFADDNGRIYVKFPSFDQSLFSSQDSREEF